MKLEFLQLEGPWDLDLAGHPTNGSLPVCMRAHDAALSCKLVQERLRKNTNEISTLSCTAAGTDAQ